MAVKVIKDRIITILRKIPAYRDDDNKLISTIWLHECKAKGLSEMEAKKVLKLLANGELTSPESIRRSRQLVQEQDVTLRGEKYKERQDRQTHIQGELGYGKKS